MLEAAVLRSTVPHARVMSVDVTRARRVPGVGAVLTGADIERWGDVRTHFGPVFRDRPILAIDKVRYVGDPVVAVAAVDADVAREALQLVEVEYEELPPVLTLDDALADDAPLLHEGPPQTGATFADVIVNAEGGTNICNHFKLRHGDIERGLAEADHVFEDVFTSPAVQHGSQLAEIFGLPASRVRVIVRTLGGGFGAKCYPAIEPIAAVLSKAAGRPVRLHLSREEEFITITKHAVRIRMTTGLRSDGKVIARKAICHFNTGAYADIGPRLIKNGGYGTGGPHDVRDVWVDSYAVYTNLPPAGAYRGYGISQAAWAYETQMDMIAERLGIDALELRMRNLLVDGQAFATGDVMDDAHFRELLSGVAERVGWQAGEAPVRDGSKVRAKGLSCIIKGSITPSTSTATVKLNEDGSLHVLTSSVEMGQGLRSAVAIVASQRLGVPIERITVSTPDTEFTPYDQQTSSSRSTFTMSAAVEIACDRVAERLKALTADQLEVSIDDLELGGGVVRVKGSPDRAVDYATLVRRARLGNVLAEGTFQTEGGLDPDTGQGIAAPHWHQASGAAEVEVDLETGRTEILQYHAGIYAGRIVNPVQCELQTEGNVAFGVGHALFESLVFDSGQLQNGNLGDYMIASLEDMPGKLSIDVLENRERNEIHGIGETSLPAVVPAIANAISRATGVRIVDLPVTPERILQARRAAAGDTAEDPAGGPATGSGDG
jgi:CO/xanthine dehydrogenase Mo-binding subunit